jgi:hypothetical protein
MMDRTKRSADNKAWRLANREYVRAENRAWHYRANYGMTIADYDALLLKQGGGCAVCKTKKTGTRNHFFCVDHRHVDGYDALVAEEKRRHVRGLLCVTCNLVAGKLEEFPGAFEAYVAGL